MLFETKSSEHKNSSLFDVNFNFNALASTRHRLVQTAGNCVLATLNPAYDLATLENARILWVQEVALNVIRESRGGVISFHGERITVEIGR